MSMDIRELLKRQGKAAKEGKDKKTAVVLESEDDDDDDFRKVSTRSTKGAESGRARNGKMAAEGGGAREGTKRKSRRRARVIESDSEEEEAPKKKSKATPTKEKGTRATNSKSNKSVSSKSHSSKADSATTAGGGGRRRREIQSASDFFGSAPVKRSPYFSGKSASSGVGKRKEEEVVRVSESPTEPTENRSSLTQSEVSSQPSYSTTPTKELSIEVTRIATPPRMLPLTPQKATDTEKEKQTSVRHSPRNLLKRERTKESEREEEKEIQKFAYDCGKKNNQQMNKAGKSDITTKAIKREGSLNAKIKRFKPSTTRKAIEYLDESEGEEREEKKMKITAEDKKKEQSLLKVSGAESALSCVSPQKVKSSPRKRQMTPEAGDGYLVKQPGLTFDKDKSASPVKTPRKMSGETVSSVGSKTPVKQVSTPVKPVFKVQTPTVKSVSTTPGLGSCPSSATPTAATPGATPTGATPTAATPKVSRGSSYRNYMNRSGPKAPGSKVVPEGAENCLEGLTFVITGVLESLEREEASDIIKRYGGRVTTSLSKKTSYLVVGEEAGESKLAKAAQLGTKKIDEDGLLDLLRTRPGKKISGCGPTKPPATTRKHSSTSPSAVTKPSRASKGAKIGSKPSPSSDITGGEVGGATTPTRSHVTTPVVMATPSPGTASSSAETPQLTKNGAEGLMWVDKYRPRSLKSVIGQQGDKSSARKLLRWLNDWEKNRTKEVKATKKGGGAWGWANQGDGAGFRAALLSGPPGVGKTTTAILACEEAGYSYVELNASATRSKRLLHEEVAEHLHCVSLDSFCMTSSTQGRVGVASGWRHALIMDEVDGMAGNEDRGGMQEVISMIKTTKVPIICICNDRQHPKIRSLSNHCYDLRFPRPRVDQIRGAMMSICFKEGVKMAPNALSEVIMASGQDVRQVLHNLSVWTATDKNMSYDKAKETARSAKKESKLNPFDVIKLVFMPIEGGRDLSLVERSDLFFHDYSLAPLFVQENYPSVKPLQAKGDLRQTLRLLGETAECLSDGDIVEKRIRSVSQWGLLPVQAIFSSVLPGQLMRGHVGRPEFPRWLGNNSTRGKNDRLLQELQRHTRLRASCNKTDFGLDYLPFLHTRLTLPLISQGSDGVLDVVAMMTTYDLAREDWDSIVELNQFTGRPNTTADLPSKVKAAFTRAYNKEQHKTHYAITDIKKSRTSSLTDSHHDDNLEESPDSEPELDGVSDRMVKVKGKTSTSSSGNGKKRESGTRNGEKEGATGKGKPVALKAQKKSKK